LLVREVADRRLNILREYAVLTDKTMTAVIEDYIGSLPNAKIGNSMSSGHATRTTIAFPVNPTD